ncbi:MAG: TlyA family RNA methyltransferase [Verrucomicrobiota bacterium]
MAKQRLDQLLVEKGLCDSREQAKRLIMAGEVLIGTAVAAKPAVQVSNEEEITVKESPRYVSRGGIKLEGALNAFGIDPEGKVCMDVGSSTGGFTDCLLQRGARKVYAFDVGTNQLVWKLRNDPRVVSREKFNVRYIKPKDVDDPIELCLIDVSFISLTLILGPVFEVLAAEGNIICLVKPQFEAPRKAVGKGGVIRDESVRVAALNKIYEFVVEKSEKVWHRHIDSPISGTDGNLEYFAWLTH